MSQAKYHVTAIGNALVDVLAQVDHHFIHYIAKKYGIEPNCMTLIDKTQALGIYADITGKKTEMAGGCASNTMACFASFSQNGKYGDGAYIGKVSDDSLGKTFRKSLQNLNITYATNSIAFGADTGRCMVLVTPDGERTLCTYLGAATELTVDDIDFQTVGQSQITYLEGFLFDKDPSKKAFIKAANMAHENGHRVALSLSDPFCVNRHRDDFLSLIQNHIDVVFANEEEIKSLYQTNDFNHALAQASQDCDIAALTRGALGSVIVQKQNIITVEAVEVKHVIDTTGAGDSYAAGFLFGLTNGLSLSECGHLGSAAAAHIISHLGGRPQQSLYDLTQPNLPVSA